MSSVVEICNLALGHIANSAELTSIDPPDGTPEADHCARFYPLARDICLESYAWSFSTVRKYLSELSTNPMEDIWGFAYGLPNQMIRPLAVLLPTAQDSEGKEYRIETLEDGTGVLYTNVEDAILKYVYRQEDSTKFTPMFTAALSSMVGSFLAGPIAKDVKMKQALRAQALLELAEAAKFNRAQKVNLYRDFTPSQIEARNS